MKAHHLGVGLALLTVGTLALAQAPAAKPTIPQVCLNCHQAKPGNVQGYFENVAFKSKSIQLKIDAGTEIVRFDEGTLKVVDVEKTGKGDMLRDIAKGREARIEYAEKDGVKTATLISFKGIDQARRPRRSSSTDRCWRWSSRARRSRTPC